MRRRVCIHSVLFGVNRFISINLLLCTKLIMLTRVRINLACRKTGGTRYPRVHWAHPKGCLGTKRCSSRLRRVSARYGFVSASLGKVNFFLRVICLYCVLHKVRSGRETWSWRGDVVIFFNTGSPDHKFVINFHNIIWYNVYKFNIRL